MRRLLSCFLVLSACFLLMSPAASANDDPPDGITLVTADELKGKMGNEENIAVLDVRSAEDYEGSDKKIKGAVRMPLEEIEERHREIPKNVEIIAYCG